MSYQRIEVVSFFLLHASFYDYFIIFGLSNGVPVLSEGKFWFAVVKLGLGFASRQFSSILVSLGVSSCYLSSLLLLLEFFALWFIVIIVCDLLLFFSSDSDGFLVSVCRFSVVFDFLLHFACVLATFAYLLHFSCILHVKSFEVFTQEVLFRFAAQWFGFGFLFSIGSFDTSWEVILAQQNVK